jgi:hypothetical protein
MDQHSPSLVLVLKRVAVDPSYVLMQESACKKSKILLGNLCEMDAEQV